MDDEAARPAANEFMLIVKGEYAMIAKGTASGFAIESEIS